MARGITNLLRQRAEIVVLVLLLLGTRLLKDPSVPAGIYALGLASGAAVALQAIGLVIVYRANRIINFSQVQMGVLAGTLFLQFVNRRFFVLALRKVCPPCVPAPETFGDLARFADPDQAFPPGVTAATKLPDDFAEYLPSGYSIDDLSVYSAPDWMTKANFWIAVVISLGLAILVSWLLYSLIVRRFTRAPRLIATVMTLGLGQVFAVLGSNVGRLFGDGPGEGTTSAAPGFGGKAIPYELNLRIDPVTFKTGDILFVIAAVIAVVGLTIFFTRSATGVVLRASSENPDRAQTLGVNVGGVTSVAWMIAGGLSAVAAIIAQTGVGVGGAATEVRYLAAAVIGGMVSIPITVAAALVLGIVDAGVAWSIRTPGFMDGLVLAIIVVVLLVQRSRASRSDAEADGGWKAAREMRPIPAELRDIEVVRRWVRTARVVGVLFILGLPWLLSPSQTNLAAVTMIYAMVTLSLLVLTGWAGQISLGQFGLAAVGAWVTAAVGGPFPFSLIIGGLAGAAVAVVIGVPALRLRGLHLAITTLAFAVTVTAILLNPTYLGGLLPESLERPTILGLRLDDQRTFYYFVLVVLVIAVVGTIGMRRSRTARALLACRENEVAAQAFGINLLRARLAAFACSGFMAAIAGGMFAFSQNGVSAAGFEYRQSIKMFLMVVIGGLGSIAGPLIGAGFIGAIDMFAQDFPEISLLTTGLGTVALLLFMPGGLGEAVFGVRDAMLRRVADRYRIEVPSLIADRTSRGDRADIMPKTRPGGGTVFVPPHYRADGQWSIEARHKEAVGG